MTLLEKTIKMANSKPVEIISNSGNNNRQFPMLANLSDTEMVEFYHGIGSGVALVDKMNDEIIAFRYNNEDDDSVGYSIEEDLREAGIELPKFLSERSCEFSAAQILFPNK